MRVAKQAVERLKEEARLAAEQARAYKEAAAKLAEEARLA